ncbi:MAG: sulfurtransferase TusA family protein [Candidatus Omnitrophota bacterium]|nr:sulfurtransferase TusA family protein [Candidatus Omnitrophota bacterium]
MFKLPKEVIDSIDDYKKALAEFLELKINPARFKGIRVPWGIYNQRGGKLFMVRIRVVSGQLDAGQLNALARASRLYGNGILHITTRQDIQIHDVKIEDTIKIIEELKDYNLSPRGGGGNTVRNIVVCPLAGLCEDEVFDTRPYVTALSEYLLKSPDSYTLPRKLKIAFSGCGKDCALATITDIGFIAKNRDTAKGFKVYAGGGMGSGPRVGMLLEDFVTDDKVGYVAAAVKKVFSKYGERKDRHHARLRFLVEKIGPDKFKELYKQEIAALKDSEHIVLRDVDCKASARKGRHIARIRAPFGDLPAEDAAALAGLAGRIPDIVFRTSQRQNIYIVNIPPDDAEVVHDELKRIGRGLTYAQNAKDIVCCAGATTCNLGFCNSKGLAKELERILEDVNLCRAALTGISINVNGCPNSCGQHPIGAIGLHGLARKVGLKTAPFYRIFVGGIAQEARTALGRDLGIVPAKNTPLLIKDFLVRINPDLKEGVDVHQYILEKGVPIMEELIKRYAYIPDFEEDKSFYKDWGKDEPFTLEGLTQGECGAGVIDMIESDLDEARKNLALAKTEGFSTKHSKEAIHLSSRALVIVKGIEPRTAIGAIDSFKKEFIDKKIASIRFKDILDAYIKGTEDKEGLYRYAKEFYEEVKRVYDSMDSNFNFSVRGKGAEEPKGESEKALDLRGVACPLNYVKTKLYLETQDQGALVDVYLDDGEPMANVPKSLENDGQEIVDIRNEGAYFIVKVRKLR